jgi:hypothetical protein
MQYLLERFGRSILPICLLIVVSGCGVFLPPPSHQETVEINPTITNQQLTDSLLAIFSEKGIAPCRGTRRSDNDLPACSIPWWPGYFTKVDRDAGVIEIGDFPAYTNNIAGHTARFRRVSDSTLEITVKGVGVYLSALPNENVARKLVAIIEDSF